jgi:hypothetical protein
MSARREHVGTIQGTGWYVVDGDVIRPVKYRIEVYRDATDDGRGGWIYDPVPHYTASMDLTDREARTHFTKGTKLTIRLEDRREMDAFVVGIDGGRVSLRPTGGMRDSR